MECVFCGRKKRRFESFTKFGFCPDCNAEVRSRIKKGLEATRAACELCTLRMEENICPLTDSELLLRIGDALETIEDLEDLRPVVPFFKSPTMEMQDQLTLCKRALASGRRPVVIRPSLSLPEREREAFLGELEHLPVAPIKSVELAGILSRNDLRPLKTLVPRRIARTSNCERLSNYVALDLKTTGVNPKRDEIVEVSAIRFVGGAPTERFHAFVLPARPIPAQIERLCGVTNEMVRGAALLGEVIPALQKFLAEEQLVSYGVLSDLQFLYASGLKINVDQLRCYDIRELAESMLTLPESRHGVAEEVPPPNEVANFRLDTLCLRYSIHYEESFQPSADCLSAGLLFYALVRERTAKQEVLSK